MKIINQLFLLYAALFFDTVCNGIMGRWFSSITLLAYAYHVSFFSPKILRLVSACLVATQAFLYGVTTPFFYGIVIVMLCSAGFFNKFLREDRWVRWLLMAFYSIALFLVLFLPTATNAIK